jgi:excisionase family DNA binding protein
MKAKTKRKESPVTQSQIYSRAEGSVGGSSSLRVVAGSQDAPTLRANVEPTSDRSPPAGTADFHRSDPKVLPYWLTVDEVAAWLRTTRKAVYARVERGRLPGAVRNGRRLLVRRDILVKSLVAAGSAEAGQP